MLSPRTERGGPNSPHADSLGTLLSTGRECRDTHTHTHTHIHAYTFTGTHTNPAGLKWAQHFDIDLFFLSLPHPPIFSSLTPHLLLDSPLAHHRAVLQASAEEEGGEGRGRAVGAYLERWRGERRGRVGRRRKGGGTIT